MKTQGRSFTGRLAVLATLAASLMSATARALDCPNVKVVPQGLKAGDQYYLAFATADQMNATSTKIADYNDFVTKQASDCKKLMGIKWTAIASTADVSAKKNLGLVPALPIYLVDGKTRVVAKAADLFSGNALENPISKDQLAGTFKIGEADTWTGTTAKGEISKFPLGNKDKQAFTTKGLLSSKASPAWVENGTAGKANTFSFYAISEVRKVPNNKPDLAGLTVKIMSVPSDLVEVGQSASLVVSVQAEGEPVADTLVEFTDVLGDLLFVADGPGSADRQLITTTDANGEARTQFAIQQPGLAIIQAKAGNSTVRVSIAATNMPLNSRPE